MNITAGKMLRQYAILIGEPVEIVVDFVRGYVNNPIQAGYASYAETEAERFQEVKDYIEHRITNSSTERIRNDIKLSKLLE